ncbi:MAG: 30S ribosomal protein S27e [Candidatus Micrarchaeia archaeon]
MGKFVIAKCKCGYEQPLFKYITSEVKCGSCGAVLARPTGGTANVLGKIEKELD